ncbi:MAG: hypothetical protein JWQ43_2458 [Glaciihabitans sp.]|nr:hypothetical protein [Glaciihabitans sp.]
MVSKMQKISKKMFSRAKKAVKKASAQQLKKDRKAKETS